MNLMFFGSMLVPGFFVRYPPLIEEPITEDMAGRIKALLAYGPLLLAVYIFVVNIFLSAFLVVTLSGLPFFALPAFFLAWRGYIWGTLLTHVPTPIFLLALPTMVLEGEAYVVAAVAGMNLGLSWLKPKWVYRDGEISRSDALKLAFKECAYTYVLVALLLTVAAVVEVITIQHIYQEALKKA